MKSDEVIWWVGSILGIAAFIMIVLWVNAEIEVSKKTENCGVIIKDVQYFCKVGNITILLNNTEILNESFVISKCGSYDNVYVYFLQEAKPCIYETAW